MLSLLLYIKIKAADKTAILAEGLPSSQWWAKSYNASGLRFLLVLSFPRANAGFDLIVQPLTWILHFDSFKKNAWNSANH